MKGYDLSLNELIRLVNPTNIHEVGCGEGYWTLNWLEKGIHTRGSDFSNIVIQMARSTARTHNLPFENFIVRNIYNLDPVSDKSNLVVCCQVLEHLERPNEALISLKQISDPFLIVCVPNEPLWSLLNLARGKYWSACGNTPGHLQRWSKKQFINLVSQYFDILKINTPIPWTMLLCKFK
jgi:SAM-dependent methyltransferase